MTSDLQAVVEVLRREQGRADAFGVELIGIVGSVARGEAGPDSDIDLVVRQTRKTTLFQLSRLEEELGDVLGLVVDLVFSEAMAPDRRAYIERDLVRL